MENIDLSNVFTVSPESASDCWFQKVAPIDPQPLNDQGAIVYEHDKLTVDPTAPNSVGVYWVRVEALDREKLITLETVTFRVNLVP